MGIGNEKGSINIFFDLIVKGADLGGRNIISVDLDAKFANQLDVQKIIKIR